MDTGLRSYEVVPYAGKPHIDTHPDRLATIASLFGMNPPEVPRARILEIGCASGANLIPMAAQMPEGSFVGIDQSERHVAEGRAVIEAAGLKNVALMQINILEAGPELGTFDYIICHGVFSWVPPEVQQKILTLIAATLDDNGVAVVSYNVYPGWHLRAILRDAMFFHIDSESDTLKGLERARELLDFLVQFPSVPENYYMTMLRDIRKTILQGDESYLCHDFLEEVNCPVYYHQFLEHAATAGLKAVSDSRFSVNACVAPEDVKAALGKVSDDPERQETYLDFLKGRTFRRTVLCRAAVDLLPKPSVQAVHGLQAAVRLPPGTMQPGISVDMVEGFRDANNQAIMIDHPILKGAVLVLGERFPQAMPFSDLWLAALDRVARAGLSTLDYGEPERRRLAEFLFRSFSLNWVELHMHLPAFVRKPGERPATTQLARYQARSGGPVTNLRHEPFNPTQVERCLLGLLDGQRTHDELVDALDSLLVEGKITIQGIEPGLLAAASRRTIVSDLLRQGLARLAECALIMA